MTNEKIRENIASLKAERKELISQLNEIDTLKSERKLTKIELRKEAALRKDVQAINEEIANLKRKIKNRETLCNH